MKIFSEQSEFVKIICADIFRMMRCLTRENISKPDDFSNQSSLCNKGTREECRLALFADATIDTPVTRRTLMHSVEDLQSSPLSCLMTFKILVSRL